MRTFKTLPTNRVFYEQYATLIPTLYRLGFLAQIVSALTEISIIYSIVFSSVRDFAPALAPFIGALGAIIGTLFIEVGLRQFLPYSVRAIIYRRFSGLDLAMTVFIIVSMLALLLTSGILSFKNSKTIVEAMAPTPEIRKTDEESIEYDNRRAEVLAKYQTDSSATAARYNGEFNAIQNKYSSLIGVERAKLKEVNGREQRTGQFFTTQKERINTKIAELEANQNNELATVQQRSAAELATLQHTRKRELETAYQMYENARRNIEAANKEAKERAELKVNKYGSGLGWFTLICLGVLVFSIIIYEVHHKGSGIVETVHPTQYDFLPGVLGELQTAIAERFNFSARSRIRRFAEATPAPPLPLSPAPLYDIGQMEQPRFMLQFQPGTGGAKPIYINVQTPHWANSQPVSNGDNPGELEEQILGYCRAAEQLKGAGLNEPAREMELKASEVIRLYLGPDGSPEAIEELRAAIIEHLKGNRPNPFEHLHRRPIGFNRSVSDDLS